ncbi:MAG: glutamate-5-semialdehyde dehydrogenase [Alkalispirochaeta sp.]
MSAVRENVSVAHATAKRLGAIGGDLRRKALHRIAELLEREEAAIAAANARDLERAEAEDLPAPLLKRLRFDGAKLEQAVTGVRSVADLPDPVGRVLLRRELDEGLVLRKETCPIGVIAMIFESRPDALVQIASLALKSGNAVVLKGGSEARESNRILAGLVARGSEEAGIPAGWIQLLETRDDVTELLKRDDLVDLMIPRGSNEFVRYIMDHTRIPVLGHADGVCHVYLDAAAEEKIAVDVTVDSKTQYVAVCNAAETLLVHRDAAERLLPVVGAALRDAGVELRGCQGTRAVLPDTIPATEDDWAAEYLDMILSIRVVESLEDAIDHINRYGSGHTDAIVTDDSDAARRFTEAVDSASVMWNASTRFADGFRYGLGAEVGIGTGKIHARGPVGVEGLLSYKWIVEGRGHIVSDYGGGRRSFTHRDLPLT